MPSTAKGTARREIMKITSVVPGLVHEKNYRRVPIVVLRRGKARQRTARRGEARLSPPFARPSPSLCCVRPTAMSGRRGACSCVCIARRSSHAPDSGTRHEGFRLSTGTGKTRFIYGNTYTSVCPSIPWSPLPPVADLASPLLASASRVGDWRRARARIREHTT